MLFDVPSRDSISTDATAVLPGRIETRVGLIDILSPPSAPLVTFRVVVAIDSPCESSPANFASTFQFLASGILTVNVDWNSPLFPDVAVFETPYKPIVMLFPLMAEPVSDKSLPLTVTEVDFPVPICDGEIEILIDVVVLFIPSKGMLM